LRFKSVTVSAARPDGRAAERARRLPRLLWPDWSSRLLPVAALNPEMVRAVMSLCLLLPGNPDRALPPVVAALGSRARGSNISMTLQVLADLSDDAGPVLPRALAICCCLADYLDTEGAAIDYRRRRQTVPATTISWEQWRSLAPTVGAHPGDRPDRGRHRHVQRHLHQLLTGSDPADRRHPPAFTNPSDRSRYVDFVATLTHHHRRASAPSPGASARGFQALAGLVLEADVRATGYRRASSRPGSSLVGIGGDVLE
jgi:hypothetical protein